MEITGRKEVAVKVSKIIYLLYFLILLLFFAYAFTAFEIKQQYIKYIVYYGFIISSPLILTFNLTFLKAKAPKVSGVIIPALMLMVMFYLGPLGIIFSASAWKTVEVLSSEPERTEYQIQNEGAFGYNRRTVKVTYITPLFMIVQREEPNQ